jgi:hypothetical protein
MGNKLAGLLVLIFLCVGGYFVWRHFHEQQMEYSGEVTCQGCMTPERKAAFEKENSGDTPDGQSEHKTRTAAADDKAGFPDATATVNGTPGTQAGSVSPAPTYPSAQTTSTTQTETPAAPQTAAAAPMVQPTTPATGPMPVTDSQSANAPNGARFGGSGTYQWYRQGNLTWRIDTTTGRSCIIYATMEEWQKQIVISHGCGRAA